MGERSLPNLMIMTAVEGKKLHSKDGRGGGDGGKSVWILNFRKILTLQNKNW